MRFVRLMFLLLPIVCCASGFSRVAFCQTANVTVVVVGTGSSIDEARADAVRQSLQSTVKQLVVVDRAISQNEILRDKVLSTMNGYIESYKQLSVSRTGGGYELKAEITVSASRIENYIAIPAGGGGSVDSQGLLAEQNRRKAQMLVEQEQIRARGEIFDRTMIGFPSAAINLRLLNLSLSQRDPNILTVQVEYSFSPTFVRAILGTLKSLALMECAPPRQQVQDWDLYQWSNGARSLRYCGAGEFPGPLGFFKDDGTGNGICLRLDEGMKCFSLAPGSYCASCDLQTFGDVEYGANPTKRFLLFWRFLDETGLSANRQSNCFVNPVAQVLPQIFFRKSRTVSGGFVGALDLRRGTATFEINSSQIDIARAKVFVAISGLVMPDDAWGGPDSLRSNRWLTSLVSGPDYPNKGGCAHLERAAQYAMLKVSPGTRDTNTKTFVQNSKLVSAEQQTDIVGLWKGSNGRLVRLKLSGMDIVGQYQDDLQGAAIPAGQEIMRGRVDGSVFRAKRLLGSAGCPNARMWTEAIYHIISADRLVARLAMHYLDPMSCKFGDATDYIEDMLIRQ